MTTHITPDAGGGRRWLLRGFAFVCGLGALAWFLLRVIPKPSRASYPCQRAAFPVAGSFVPWMAAWATSRFAARRWRRALRGSGVAVTSACAAVPCAVFPWATPADLGPSTMVQLPGEPGAPMAGRTAK